ncbi:MAG: carbonic anhydrase [Bacteroidetes bacterium]|nr:carbonic anhydrase [Bacteroidota bacterium]
MKSHSFTLKLLSVLVVFLFIQSGCSNPNKEEPKSENTEVKTAPVEDVLSAEEQAALTPDQVIQLLKEGNLRFTGNALTERNHSAMVRKSANGQFPKAIILSCVDSRVPVEDVFDRGIGDLFVARVAGNVVNEDILGSMEYACKVVGSKLILVLGHEYCGAVKAAIDHVEMGNITALLSHITPVVDREKEIEGERNSKNKKFVHAVCMDNVRNTIQEIHEKSPILKELEDSGAIRIVGAMYDMETGTVEFLER